MSKNPENKLTKREKNWILYDVANSAYVLFACTLLPIFFNTLATEAGISSTDYLAYFSAAGAIATAVSMFAGPFVGAKADLKGKKKPLFLIVVAIASALCLVCGFAYQWLVFLVVFVLGKIMFNVSLVIYDSMLGDVTTEDRLDEVSSHGYAWGYIGSVIPFIICLVFYVIGSMVLPGKMIAAGKVDIPAGADAEAIAAIKDGLSDHYGMIAMSIGFVLTALWWFFVSMPLYKSYEQVNYISEEEAKANSNILTQLAGSIKEAAKDKKVFWFLIAFFFYIDGVYTIIDLATAYGKSLGLDTIGLLGALLLTQFVAFPSAITIGKLSKKYSVETLIKVCMLAYFCIGVFTIFLAQLWQFWVLAVAVGLFQGGIQALSRSYFTKIIPSDKSGELFGLYDVFGKGATFLGSGVVSIVTKLTGHQNIGIGALTSFFVIGFFLFLYAQKQPSNKASESAPVEDSAE